MYIRNYIDSDIDSCTKLFISVFNKEPWNDNWTQERAKLYLEEFTKYPNFRGVVAEIDKSIIGFIFGSRKSWWSGDEYFINEICVENAVQRTGIGSKLLRYLEEALQREGVKNITLLTKREIPAERFYLKNDFRAVDKLMYMYKRIN
jgi:ribosomal protein S18 acetylase RimI-like enzyme